MFFSHVSLGHSSPSPQTAEPKVGFFRRRRSPKWGWGGEKNAVGSNRHRFRNLATTLPKTTCVKVRINPGITQFCFFSYFILSRCGSPRPSTLKTNWSNPWLHVFKNHNGSWWGWRFWNKKEFSANSNRLSLTGSTGSAGARLASVEELDVADDCDADEGIDEGLATNA